MSVRGKPEPDDSELDDIETDDSKLDDSETDDSELDDSETNDSESDLDDSESELFSLLLFIWNHNKGTGGGKYAHIRNTIVSKILSQVKEKAFICHQEVKVNDDTARTIFLKNEKPDKYFYMSRKESSKRNDSTRQAISFPYELENYKIKNDDVKSDRATVGRHYSQLITVTRGEYKVSFVLVSYHAPHKAKNKKDKLKEFLEKMCEIADNEEVPVIVGGDFNFDVDEWRDSIMKEFKGRVNVAPIYKGIPGRPHETKIIDTFLVVYPKKTQYIVMLYTPVPVCPIPKDDHNGILHYSEEDYREIKRITQESYKEDHRNWKSILNKLLDHDLVMINIDIYPRMYILALLYSLLIVCSVHSQHFIYLF